MPRICMEPDRRTGGFDARRSNTSCHGLSDPLTTVMPSERDKMLAGELYDPLDADLVARRVRARDLCQALNASNESETDHRRAILRDLFGTGGDTVWMQ